MIAMKEKPIEDDNLKTIVWSIAYDCYEGEDDNLKTIVWSIAYDCYEGEDDRRR